MTVHPLLSDTANPQMDKMWASCYRQRTTKSQGNAPMSRISIDVTDAEHKKLKALAALQGQSIKEFVLSRTIGDETLAPALAELERLLDDRMGRAREEGFSKRSVEDIFEAARREGGPSDNA